MKHISLLVDPTVSRRFPSRSDAWSLRRLQKMNCRERCGYVVVEGGEMESIHAHMTVPYYVPFQIGATRVKTFSDVVEPSPN